MTAVIQLPEHDLRILLVDRLGLLTPEEFEAARLVAQRFHVPLEEALCERGRLPPRFLLEQLAQYWGVEYTDLDVSSVERDALSRVRADYARSQMVMPFRFRKGKLSVALANPLDQEVLQELSNFNNLQVIPYLASAASIHRAHLLYRGNLLEMLKEAATEEKGDAGRVMDAETAPGLLTRILEYAGVTGASDIHIEPYQHETLVRFRIDGVLQEVLTASPAALQPLVARIKALANMRIDERRAPQDGRFEGDLEDVKLDLRVSTLPTHWGEKVVMRVLAQQHLTIDLESLGLASKAHETILRTLSQPHGMILVTGPTGCGKSSTLYAMLARLEHERLSLVNISTIEDPVELPLPRISQVSVNVLAGIDFASGLRALLRQDPDIIMVGEIRDRETMETAIRAALVGRLLLSTLHTNDAPTAIPRLLDMGAEPFLIASSLSMVIAQRLVRRVCVNCRETLPADSPDMDTLRARPEITTTLLTLQEDGVLGAGDDQLSAMRLFRGKGCPQCNGTGYRGRVGVFEILEIDREIRQLILERRDVAAIRDCAVRNGMRTMFADALGKVFLGETTVHELVRVSM
jgi:type IV pilus assembly protein PilB